MLPWLNLTTKEGVWSSEVIGVERKSLNMNLYFSVLWQCTPAA